MSKPEYMKKKPAHFGTRLSNPYTRYGDKPYIQCPNCNLLWAALGFSTHYRNCIKKSKVR